MDGGGHYGEFQRDELDMLFKELRLYSSLDRLQYALLAVSILLFIYPSFTWNHVGLVTPLAFGCLTLALSVDIFIKKRITLPIHFFIYLTYVLYTNIVGVTLTDRVFETHLVVALTVFLFSKETIYRSYLFFVHIIGALLTLSLVSYLAKLIGIYKPELVPIESTDGRPYFAYFLNVMSAMTAYNGLYLSTGFYRFFGFWGEPGWIGTLSSLILFSLKFNFRQYKILFAFLGATIFSMSLGAFIPLFIGLTFFFLRGKYIFLLGAIFLAVSVSNIELLDRFIFSRLQVEDGGIAGDNRTTLDFDNSWVYFTNSDEIWFGKGKGSSREGATSWKSIVYNSGVIGMAIYISIFLSLFYYLWKNGDKKYAYLFLFVFLLTIYHRPRIHYVYFLFVFYGGLLHNEIMYLIQKKNR